MLATPATGLDTHVADVVAHVMIEGLRDIPLVGWSDGDMVITGALAEIDDRVASVVYLDAFLPEHGRSVVDYSAGPTRAALAARRAVAPLLVGRLLALRRAPGVELGASFLADTREDAG